jgi:hypothetical protein
MFGLQRSSYKWKLQDNDDEYNKDTFTARLEWSFLKQYLTTTNLDL